MTTSTEVLEIITKGENSRVAFQRDVSEIHDLARELVAFSNHEGGTVLIGVDDDGSVIGVKKDRLAERVVNTSRDRIRPPIIPALEVVGDVRPGADVAVVKIERSSRVHGLRHRNHDSHLIRAGSLSREASEEEMLRLFQEKGLLRTDLRPIPGTGMADLDRRRLSDYFGRVRRIDLPEHDEDKWRNLLVDLDLMVEGGVTLGGMLLFGNRPRRFLPQSGIQAVAFPGVEKDYEMREKVVLHGPMTPLRDEDGTLSEPGLVDRALEFVRRNTGVTAHVDRDGRRADRSEYPDEAVREAVVNALIHRDYLNDGTDIELLIFRDRLEVNSPGKLPYEVTPERLPLGVRHPRNPLLEDVMGDYGYHEYRGMGLWRRIMRGAREHNGTDPQLVEEFDHFIVRLFSGTGEDGPRR